MYDPKRMLQRIKPKYIIQGIYEITIGTILKTKNFDATKPEIGYIR